MPPFCPVISEREKKNSLWWYCFFLPKFLKVQQNCTVLYAKENLSMTRELPWNIHWYFCMLQPKRSCNAASLVFSVENKTWSLWQMYSVIFIWKINDSLIVCICKGFDCFFFFFWVILKAIWDLYQNLKDRS